MDARGRPVALRGVSAWLARIAPARARGTVNLVLASDARVRELNRRYRGRDEPTDVLSFGAAAELLPHNARFLGEIVVARGVARRQARRGGHSELTELRVLALHGLLHLLGYDHRDGAEGRRMARIERRLRRRGGLVEGLIERAHGQ